MGDMNTQGFWNEFMRRPEAIEAQQAELRLAQKKQTWLEDKMEVEQRGAQRRIVADALEGTHAETKKLIAPMFHIRVVEQYLWMLYDESRRTASATGLLEDASADITASANASFHERLRQPEALSHLRKLREYFEAGGEERMEELEGQWHSICGEIARDEEKKKEVEPMNIDIHTLKSVLEFSQECKLQGNAKFREGLYKEALAIYSQADDVIKKWKVAKNLKNEQKWLKDDHLACLKNKAQAALKLNLFQTALDAAEAALGLDEEDHKAWFRKSQAEKGLGKFVEAEESLTRLEDVAQWCPGRQSILKDCEVERGRIQRAVEKHRQGTKDMLAKTFEAGVFGADRAKLDADQASGEAAALQRKEEEEKQERRAVEPPKRLQRLIQLTVALAGELVDEFTDAYSKEHFQLQVRKCARDSSFQQYVFLRRLRDIAFEVQKPILEKWGFEGTAHGLREMQAAVRDHAGKDGKSMPVRLKLKQDRCLRALYGGEEGGMLHILVTT